MSSSSEAEFDDGDNKAMNGDAKIPALKQDDDSDEMPIAALRTGKRKAAAVAAAKLQEEGDDAEEEASSSDDDDMPLSALVQKMKKKPPSNGNKASPKKKAASSQKKKKKKAPPRSPSSKKSKSSTTSSTGSDKKYEWASAALYGTECIKGLLIQRLLCRWWYAITWPSTDLPPPPKGHDALDGFPGVSIGTSGDSVGQILDRRDKDTCPSFANFVAKPSEELQSLLLKALEEQKKQLISHEGSGTSTEKELDKLIKWAAKVKPAKADKEAATILKASGIRLR